MGTLMSLGRSPCGGSAREGMVGAAATYRGIPCHLRWPGVCRQATDSSQVGCRLADTSRSRLSAGSTPIWWPDFPPGESIILQEFYRTIQIEYCFVPSSNGVNMRWSMIVWIHHSPQSVKPQNRRHYTISSNIPKRLGFRLPNQT
jgi:hypothetical protein